MKHARGNSKQIVITAAIIITASIFASVMFAKWFPLADSHNEILSTRSRMDLAPEIMFWAWERPEDLSFIDPREAGVAFLAMTIRLRGDKVISQPRLQPVQFPEGVYLMAVARIESDRFDLPAMTGDQLSRVASEILELAQRYSVSAIQVDFDARSSERVAYRRLLEELRRKLPDRIALSITALASWCIYDDWTVDLPIDEAVPMLFRMGADNHKVVTYLESGGEFRSARCGRSFGISTDEPMMYLPGERRVYIFNPRGWSRESAQQIIKEVKQWR